jgi:hypothetical protein
MPNINILNKYAHSSLLDAIQTSNIMKIARDARIGLNVSEDLVAVPAGV